MNGYNMKKQDDNLFCGDDREEDLSDMYFAENEYFVSLDEIDFELDDFDEGDFDETSE